MSGSGHTANLRGDVHGFLAEGALLVVSVSAGLGALRLTTRPGQARVFLPVLTAVLAGHVAAAVAHRVSATKMREASGSSVVTIGAGVVATALVSVWTVAPSATRFGLPTPTTGHVIMERLREAGAVITSHPTPLAPITGVVLCFTAGAGLVAVLGRALWANVHSSSHRSLASATVLVPSLGLFVYAAVLSSGKGRVPSSVVYLASALLFLVAADRTRTAAPSSEDGKTVAPRQFRSGVGACMACAALALGVLFVSAPGLSRMRLDALPFKADHKVGLAGPGTGTGTGPNGRRSAFSVGPLSLIDNLQSVLTKRSQVQMFSARTPVPTYWQLATLSQFYDDRWMPDPATALVATRQFQGDFVPPQAGLPALPQPAGPSTYSTDVALAAFGGPLLPVPPTTLYLSGSRVAFVPGLGAVALGASSDESPTYSAVAQTPSDSVVPAQTRGPATNGEDGSSVYGVPGDLLTPFTSIPTDQVSARVVALARQIVQGVPDDPASQALAIERWLDNGSFRYTLDPPSTPGVDALDGFLFVTRAGFCQQFAGAYGVLARLDGLPTRLAVGFATGTPERRSTRAAGVSVKTYRITGADAHVWPEVYLGPSAGWVSFEPTPPVTSEPSGTGIVTGTSSPQTTVTSTTPTLPTTTSPTTSAASASNSGRARSAGWSTWLFAPLGALATGAIAIVLIVTRPDWLLGPLRRRAREHRARKGGPNALVVARFASANSILERSGLGRLPSETMAEHAARVEVNGWDRTASDAYRGLAALAEHASYGSDQCPDDEVAEADELARTFERASQGGRRRPGGPARKRAPVG
jgi:transglutaminase-like putative cysteine protease